MSEDTVIDYDAWSTFVRQSDEARFSSLSQNATNVLCVSIGKYLNDRGIIQAYVNGPVGVFDGNVFACKSVKFMAFSDLLDYFTNKRIIFYMAIYHPSIPIFRIPDPDSSTFATKECEPFLSEPCWLVRYADTPL